MATDTRAASKPEASKEKEGTQVKGPIRVTTGGHVAKYAEKALEVLESGSSVTLTTQLTTDPKARSALHPATLAIPRLISVVEKVKREWLLQHDEVWQYNASGALKAQERPTLERVLSGKTKPKMTHSPYLEITLSSTELDRADATVQHECKKKEKRKSDASETEAQTKRARLD